MNHATIQFYGELNDFLPAERRGKPIRHAFTDHPSVKDRIEALGVPHPEVDQILVNGTPVDFSYLVRDGDRIDVHPVSSPPTDSPALALRPPLPGTPRFVLDVHLGQLAEYLRLLGFDAWYRNDTPDTELARISADETRILLTKDRGLLKRSEVVYAYYVREVESKRQAVEVLRRFGLFGAVDPFRRCLRCAAPLQPVEKATILDRLLPKTRLYYDEFSRCPGCDRIYWKGSHHGRMQRFIGWVMAQAPAPPPPAAPSTDHAAIGRAEES